MMIKLIFLSVFVFAFTVTNAQQNEALILIQTNVGNIKAKLYNDTPKHRDNFIKYAKMGKYNGTLFYRVIKDFVIQGGSSDSKNAIKGQNIGFGKPIPMDAEILKHRFHKKGALCAPRQPDRVNFHKESDISQFYIVHGKKYTMEELDLMEKVRNIPIKNRISKKYYTEEKKAKLADLRKQIKDSDDIKAKQDMVKEFREIADKIKKDIAFEYNADLNVLEFSEEMKKAYTTIGGVQHLDMEYTVFGEVVEGFDVIDNIANLKTDKNDRPLKNITIKVRVLNR